VAANSFGTFLTSLQQVDFFTLLLPFVISYVIFTLAIKQLSLFDENEKMVSLVALSVSFFTAQFIATNPAYQTFFVEFFGRITIGMMGILGLFIVLSLAGFTDDLGGGRMIGIVVLIAVIAAFTYSGGMTAFIPFDLGSEGSNLLETLFNSGILWLLVIAAVVFWTMDSDDSDGPSLADRIFGEE
jgi:hypothetical protein